MTATDDLRRLLDERGVEWRRTPHYSSESQDNETVFEGNGIEWYANDHLNGRLGLRAVRYEVTPEQAIDATLGRGTCHDLGGIGANGEQVFNCSECHCVLSLYDRDGSNNLCTSFIFDYPRYCPECGRRVVE